MPVMVDGGEKVRRETTTLPLSVCCSLFLLVHSIACRRSGTTASELTPHRLISIGPDDVVGQRIEKGWMDGVESFPYLLTLLTLQCGVVDTSFSDHPSSSVRA